MEGDTEIAEVVKERITSISTTLEYGCGRIRCFANYCCSNPRVLPMKKIQAFMLALDRADQEVFLCTREKKVNPIQRSNLVLLLEQKLESYEPYVDEIRDLFSNYLALNFSFVASENVQNIDETNPQIDFDCIIKLREVLQSNAEVLQKVFFEGSKQVCNILSWFVKNQFVKSGIELRILPILILLVTSSKSECYQLLIPIMEAYSNLAADKQSFIDSWFMLLPKNEFIYLVESLKEIITLRFLANKDTKVCSELKPFLVFLGILHRANIKKSIITNEEFYIDVITQETSAKDELSKWLKNQKNNSNEFTFIDYPFILNCAYKSELWEIQIKKEREQQILNAYMSIMHPEYLHEGLEDLFTFKLHVRREHLIEDTLAQLMKPSMNFKRALKISFTDEQGVDEGGVRREYFLLITKELFDSKGEMFVANEENKFLWFNQLATENGSKFELCGMILGLALTNFVYLELKFPQILYKKLLGEEATLEDLKFFDWQLYCSLKKLLEYDGDVSALCLTFQVQHKFNSQLHTNELLVDGTNKIVTNQNRQQYVDLYVDWIFNESIKNQFNSFYAGFQKVISHSLFKYKFLTENELSLLICGSEVIDFAHLESNTKYESGYSKDSQVIKHFWEVLHSFSQEEKKKFLMFCTGSDRVPILGLKSLNFAISRHGDDSESLPSAHTCFNHLLLPEYSSKEKLNQKLRIAIENCQGFGLF